MGHRGIDYIAKLFDIDPKTIRRGLQELDLADDLASDQVRKKGGGRKTAIERQPQLLINFLTLLAEFTAGDPMREGVLWTNLSRCEISRRLREMGTPASRLMVRKLLKKQGLGQRKARKKKSMGAHPDRNAQFENIARLKVVYPAADDPIISIDIKKKVLIGDFAREGRTQTQATIETLDHDFPSAGQGKLIPHGIYDVVRSEGYMHLNTIHDTSELCCDNIVLWWQQQGCRHYPPHCSKHIRLSIACSPILLVSVKA